MKCSGISRTLFRNATNLTYCRLVYCSSPFSRGSQVLLKNSAAASEYLKGPLSFDLNSAYFSTCTVWLNKKKEKDPVEEDDDLDKPIQFTTSKASQLKAQTTLGGDAFPDSPWYQPHVVLFSLACFMLYFFVLREESDIDEQMEVPLWERIPGLERQQLQVVLEYNRSHNLDTKDIEERIKQLEKETSRQKP